MAIVTIQRRVPIIRANLKIYRESQELLREDAWKIDHDIAILCFEAQDKIQMGLALFAQILRLDENYSELLLSDKIPQIPEVETAIPELCSEWHSTFLPLLGVVNFLEGQRHSVDGADEFRKGLRQAESILTPDQEFFEHPKLWAMGDEAVEFNRKGLTEDLFEGLE